MGAAVTRVSNFGKLHIIPAKTPGLRERQKRALSNFLELQVLSTSWRPGKLLLGIDARCLVFSLVFTA